MSERNIARRPEPSMESDQGWGLRPASPWLLSLALVVVTFALYLPVRHHNYVNYDDSDYVSENTHVQNGLTWAGIKWAFSTGHASNWHPLTWMSHMADWTLFGDRPGAHHLVSVAFHAANGVLLFLLLRALTGAIWRSVIVAAIFALHPIHVESVAWISERKDVLSTFFFLLTLLAYESYARATQAGARRRWPWYFGVLVLFALGLLCKPMLVTTPFVLLLLDLWPLGRVANWQPRSMSGLVLEKLPLFALSLASSVITFLVQRHGGAVSVSLTLGERLANGSVSYARYVAKTFWPVNLSVLYPHPGHWPVWQVVGAAVLLVVLTGLVLWAWRRCPYLAVGWLWFVGTLVPVIGLIQVGIQSMADRYMYIPLIGLALAVVWAAADVVRGRPLWERFALVAALLALCGCGLTASRQLGYWRNSETLFTRATQVTARNYLAYNNLGFYLSRKGKTVEALENYRKSLDINPAYEDALNNYGFALAGQKRFVEAVPYYERALRTRPDQVEVHNNLGNALSELGRVPEAIEHYRFALSRDPEHADAHNNLGIALAMQGKLDEAVEHFQAAIRFKPKYASAHSNLGNAYAVQRKFDLAIAEFSESLRLNPDDPQAHNNLGNVLVETGRVSEAIPHYEAALRLNPVNPEANCNLGLALLRLGKRDEAIARFQEALRQKPDYAEPKRQLEALSAH